MAKQRVINTKFWSDGFVRTKLNPLDRYLFLYYLTNERTTICGAYELPIEIVSSETGIEKETIEKMIPRLEGKVELIDSWVIIPNFIRHQTLNPSVLQGINREYEALPFKVKDRLYTVWVQSGLLNLTKLNLTKPIGIGDKPQTHKVKEIQSTKFKKPTVQEIETYIKEKDYNVDASRFFNFYESKGWKVGKNPMVSWKASTATWKKEEPKTSPSRATQLPPVKEEYTKEEMENNKKRMAEMKANLFKK